jgi:hypothetical protein
MTLLFILGGYFVFAMMSAFDMDANEKPMLNCLVSGACSLCRSTLVVVP